MVEKALGQKSPPTVSDRYGFAALAIYLAASACFFGRGVLGHLSEFQIGKTRDPQLMMWLMAWWPHAIANHLNPFFSRAAFAPDGFNVAWTTSTPILSILAAPITIWFGPTVTYNVLCILFPALAAGAAFILCRAVTEAWWPSLMGGYLFGFSSYTVGQAAAHLAVLPIFPIPLFAWWTLRGMRGQVRGPALVTGLTLALVVQFLCEIEIFATMTMFIAIAFALALPLVSGASRKAVRGMLGPVGQSYVLTLLLVSPFLYFVSRGYRAGPINSPLVFSTDLLNFLLPTPAMELGRLRVFETVTSRFLGNIFETTGYVGLPLMAVAAVFGRVYWHQGWGKFLVGFAIVAAILSLGPFLLVRGRIASPAPAALLMYLPLLNKTLPARFTIYMFLALALMTAIWLRTSKSSPALRTTVAVTIALSMLPNLSAGFWTTPLLVPRFFTDGLYRKYLAPGENALLLPWGDNGDGDLWQLSADWYFNQVGGNLGTIPVELRSWPVFYYLAHEHSGALLPAPAFQFKTFLAAHQTGVILVDSRRWSEWSPLLATLDQPGVESGGIRVYRTSQAELANYRRYQGVDAELYARKLLFAALVVGTDLEVTEARPLLPFSTDQLEKFDLSPEPWLEVPPRFLVPWSEGRVNLFPCATRKHLGYYEIEELSDDRVAISIGGSQSALRAVSEDYKSYASNQSWGALAPSDECGEVPKRFPNLFALADGRSDPGAWLTMTFDQPSLARAALHAHSIFSK